MVLQKRVLFQKLELLMTQMIKVATDGEILKVHALRELVLQPHNAHSRPVCMMLALSAFVQMGILSPRTVCNPEEGWQRCSGGLGETYSGASGEPRHVSSTRGA